MPEDKADRMPRSPAVSVIIPAFKAADQVGLALSSVFSQTYTDVEVIVINDGSPDTEAMELAIAPYLPRILYLKQENRGPSGARNLGIRHAKGKFLAFLDSDDCWLPNYLDQQLKFLRSDAALDMVYCDAILEGDTNDVGKTFMEVYPSTGSVTFESVLLEHTQIITSGTVVRRQKVVEAGLFDEQLHCAEDHDLWLRLVHTGAKIAYQEQALLRRRVRRDSQGSSPGVLLAGEIQSLTKLHQVLDLNPTMRASVAKRLRNVQAALALLQGKEFLVAGEPDKAYRALKDSQVLAPSPGLCAMLVGLRIAPRLTVSGARFWRARKARSSSD